MASGWHVVGWSIAALVAIIMVVNAVFMLLSPRAWFRLPKWVGAWGSLTQERYSTGWGGIQVRITGAVILGGIGWVLYDFLIRR